MQVELKPTQIFWVPVISSSLLLALLFSFLLACQGSVLAGLICCLLVGVVLPALLLWQFIYA